MNKDKALDLALAECEQENRLLKARVDRMQREFALERQRLLDENTEIYGLLGMAHLNLKQHLEYGFNPNTAKSTLISVGRYAPKLREAMNGWKENKPTPRQWVGLDWLPEHKCGLHLSHNEHRDVYETVEQFYDADDFISEEEWDKAVAEDSVWVLHWYPNTPVGFTRIAASTLEAIEAKLKEKNT